MSETKNCVSDPIFINPEHGKKVIVMMDASGSVLSGYGETGLTVFQAMCKTINEILRQHNINQFQALFWNSDNVWPQGVMSFPFYLTQDRLVDVVNNIIRPKINNKCLTQTWQAFNQIPKEWLNHVDPINLYLVTDGEIGYGGMSTYDKSLAHQKLAQAIKKITTEYNNVQIHIVTVENKIRNFNNLDEIQNAAGCDVFNIIQNQGLTSQTSSFRAFTPNHPQGFVHFTNIRCPPGFVPYKNQYFPLNKSEQFYSFIRSQIPNLDQEQLYTLINDLAPSLKVLTQTAGITPHIANRILDSYCKLFTKVADKVDPVLVKFILQDTIERDRQGRAEIVAEFRSKVKNLFKEANQCLVQSVTQAIGLTGDQCLSLPLLISPTEETIVVAPRRMMNQEFLKTYKSGAMETPDHRIIPLLPYEFLATTMSEQCLRQWIRAVVGRMYNFPVTSDAIIYTILGLNLRVFMSGVSYEVKSAYQKLGLVMLKKKRLQANETELAYLQAGHPTVQNTEFINSMARIHPKLHPMSVWLAICMCLRDDALINHQIVHCIGDLAKDGIQINNLPDQLLNKFIEDNAPVLTVTQIPPEYNYEYQCLITLENTEATGGHLIASHVTDHDQTCSPNQVLSNDGYQQFIKRDYRPCPICYSELAPEAFQVVGPRPEFNLNLPAETAGCYSKEEGPYKPSIVAPNSVKVKYPSKSGATSKLKSSSKGKSHLQLTLSSNPDQKRYLIYLKGAPCSGKSTTAQELQRQIMERDPDSACLIINMEQRIKNGDYFPKVQDEMIQFMQRNHPKLFIIIDSCGFASKAPPELYGVEIDPEKWTISHFKIHLPDKFTSPMYDQYMAWCLSNGLKRDQPPELSKYLKLYQTKSNSVFTRAYPFPHLPATIDEILTQLQPLVQAFPVVPIETQVREYLCKL